MNPVKREIEDVERFEEILHILFEQGFSFVLDELDLMHRIPVVKRLKKPRNKKPGPERTRETFEKLGSTFIKFGQILSERPDIIPERYCEELEKLQDSAPEFSTEKAKEILEEEIDTDRIKDFEEEPVASASIAQVHRATLDTGEEVILKIRRPGIKDQMEKDLNILTYLAGKADKHVDIGGKFISGEVKEFGSWTREELDLKKEARNAQVFQENMQSEDNIRIPDVHMDLTTEKVLTMEYVEAVKVDDVEKLRDMDIDEEEIAKTGIRAFIKQILRDGFLHADPHPSNFLVTEDGELLFIDFGMMTRISKSRRKDLGFLMKYVAEQDAEKLLQLIVKMSHVKEDAELEALKEEIEDKLLKLENSTIKEQSVSRILIELSAESARHGVYLPTKITLIGKGILTMEGIGLKIYPDFQVQNEFKQEVEKQLINQNPPEEVAKELAFDLVENKDLITQLPSKLNRKLEEQRKIEQIEVPVQKDKDMFDESLVLLLLLISSAILYRFAPERILIWAGITGFIAATYLIAKIQ